MSRKGPTPQPPLHSYQVLCCREENWEFFLKMHLEWRCEYLQQKWNPHKDKEYKYDALRVGPSFVYSLLSSPLSQATIHPREGGHSPPALPLAVGAGRHWRAAEGVCVLCVYCVVVGRGEHSLCLCPCDNMEASQLPIERECSNHCVCQL